MKLSEAETPCLLLDPDQLQRNIGMMAARCGKLGVTLRPHLKTPKSLQVAQLTVAGKAAPITVSTLREADYFAQGGYTDILCAAATTPNKLAHADKIQRETGTRVLLVADSAELVSAADTRAGALGAKFEFLIEVDCGEHRSGVGPASQELLGVARALEDASNLHPAGVMTHAGHSYGCDKADEIAAIAEEERAAAAGSAEALRKAGHDCAIVSVGSTPTVLHAKHMEGVTEARAGVYLFWDLSQVSRNICALEDIAVSVLASVIGHNTAGKSLVLDAGALALSKDISANAYLPDAKYGYVCDVETGKRFPGLSVHEVYQEHGLVPVPDESWFARLPIGSQVRVAPNHTCMTCAAYDVYNVVRGGEIVERWPRVNGW
ncbi:D-threo-3-hydroxyaspartate dehydratase [bacterium BMS3Bbin10]|nr:D-threo-3-hydroxyaspartate dehydratase [bacterium BMS3Bbin10]